MSELLVGNESISLGELLLELGGFKFEIGKRDIVDMDTYIVKAIWWF